jgi:PAS domain S-box-containing protein
MKPKIKTGDLQFLAGGGEMGQLIREKDWSTTPVGNPETWPQSLRTILNIIINSRFPMFLWWGPELTCFYNDAYRPSLGKHGKHPGILGEAAETAWAEIWPIIKPLIDQVLSTGEATWSEDQLIPIYRNGKIEDVYWTFSYSPVVDESGKISGVMVTCSETTEKVITLKTLENSNRRYIDNITRAPVALCIFRGENFVVEMANQLMLEIWGKNAEEVINKPIFEGLPEARGQGLEILLEQVYKTGEKFVANERAVLLPRDGHIEEVFINFVYEALREFDGSINGIVAIASEVTPQVIARRKIEESEKRFRETVKQAPLGITILRGPEFIVELANENYLQLVDKTEESFTGKPLFDSLPEVREIVQPLLTQVMQSGEAFHASEFPVVLNRYGKSELTYFNMVYHPLKEEHGAFSGIMVVATEVTSSVKAKHSLSESEVRFRNMVMQSPIPMTIFRGSDHVIEMANTTMYEDIWRKNKEDIIGKKLLDVFPELNDQKYPELLARVLSTGETHREIESIAYVQGDDGLRKFYLDFEYAPLYDPDGSISGIFVTVNNVSEKVEARKKVEDAEERLRLALEATELSTWDLDLQTRKVIHSPRLATIFGHDESKVLSHFEMRDQVHSEDKKHIVEPLFERAIDSGIYKYEARIVRPDGSIRWIRTQGKLFYDESGKPGKMIGTLMDITEEKHFRQELQESEKKFRLLADSMPQHIWTADTKGNIFYFNQTVYDYSGLTPDDIQHNGWIQIIHPEDREENINKWMHAIKTGTDFLFEHRFRRHDGQYRWQLSRAIPQKDDMGNIHMWVGTSTDIQEQKIFTRELEKQVRERTKLLKESNEKLETSIAELQKMNSELQSFAYISSHDLQEPLRKIQTFATRILEKEEKNLSQSGKDYFSRMQDAANRMQTLIDDLLSYSRTNSSERAFKKIDLGEIIEEVSNEFREVMHEKQATVEVIETCKAHVVPFQFRQLIHNLVGNALKFSRPGVLPYIKISASIVDSSTLDLPQLSPQKEYCHLRVSDNGIGFEPEYSERIFEVFQRLHGKEVFKGTGIGLAIVKKIVENHHGYVTATGEPGKGAAFDVYIPA